MSALGDAWAVTHLCVRDTRQGSTGVGGVPIPFLLGVLVPEPVSGRLALS